MMLKILFSKINLLIICSVILHLSSINAISINKLVKNKVLDEKDFEALDDFVKRDIFLKMAEAFIYPDGNMDDKFKECIETKQLVPKFNQSVLAKNIAKTMDSIGKECQKSSFQMKALEDEVFRTLLIFVDSATVKVEAIDKFRDQRESQFHTVDWSKFNNPDLNK